jgi:hypothetical protein
MYLLRTQKLYAILCLVLFSFVTANAQSETKKPTVLTQSVDGAQSDFAGTATQLQTNDNTTYVTNAVPRPGVTKVLRLTGFGFTIPVSTLTQEVTITGIEVTIDRKAATGSRIKTILVQPIVGGNITGENKGNASATVGPKSNTDYTVTYGGATDFFGLTLQPEQVNSPDFGIAFQFNNSNGSGGASNLLSIDFVSIQVFYTVKDLTVTPVTFTGFAGKKTAKGTQLTWHVANEVKVKAYEVERSSTGRTSFEKIGTVPASGASSYSFTDAAPSSGVVFYRIKNLDYDGSFKYSNLIAFANGAGTTLVRVLPTVVTSRTFVEHAAAKGTESITLSTGDGRVVRSLRPATGATKTTVEMGGLRPGLYLLKWSNGSGTVETTKILKQ